MVVSKIKHGNNINFSLFQRIEYVFFSYWKQHVRFRKNWRFKSEYQSLENSCYLKLKKRSQCVMRTFVCKINPKRVIESFNTYFRVNKYTQIPLTKFQSDSSLIIYDAKAHKCIEYSRTCKRQMLNFEIEPFEISIYFQIYTGLRNISHSQNAFHSKP